MPTIHHGDCIQVMNAMPAESVDAIVTDPPYGLGFMGRKWDSLPPSLEWAEACYRVLKPGGHIVAFGGTRTWHRLAVAIEDAGFEMRDSLAWLYGSGFPKSHDVSKAIDRMAGAEREVVGMVPPSVGGGRSAPSHEGWQRPWMQDEGARDKTRQITAPATPEAQQWSGWGTALKPGHEPVVLARKPHGISGILDGIGSELARLEDECRPSVNGAARSSAPTPAASPEVRTATAPASAVTPHEDGQEPTTPTGAAGATSDQTATSWSDETTAPTPWSTVSSWRACWAELCELTSTSTTSTTTEATTDLRTLWSSISSLTATSTPGSPTSALTSPSTASAVDSLFAATVLRLRATLALSATESATASTPHVPQDAGGSSAFEPIVLARKPFPGTVARNVLEHGVGAINVDACRIATDEDTGRAQGTDIRGGNWVSSTRKSSYVSVGSPAGRWPANVLLDQHAAAWVDEQSGDRPGGTFPGSSQKSPKFSGTTYNGGKPYAGRVDEPPRHMGDSGGASRFFYTAKAPKRERPNVDGVQHPTVKPLAVMQWLIRLVTPPGGTVLDPFAGSGTTIEAAIIEGFNPVGIEMEADYLPLIQHRIDRQAATLTA